MTLTGELLWSCKNNFGCCLAGSDLFEVLQDQVSELLIESVRKDVVMLKIWLNGS